MTDKQKTRIPETHGDLLGNTALAHVSIVAQDERRIISVWFGRAGIVGTGHTTEMGS